ncbi:MAG: DUF4402 domain-containing protein [Pseudomonadota bacterium]
MVQVPSIFTAYDRFALIMRSAAGLGTVLSACALGFAEPATAQSVETASASAEIAGDVTLVNTRDMDYGRVIVPRNGRIDMTAEEVPTCTPNNGLTLLDACQSAAFEGTALNGVQVRISVPPGRRINLAGPDRDLRLRRITVGAGDGMTFLGRTNRHFDFLITDPNGDFEFFVGARLLFRNNQGPGVYSGTFAIEADYQ